LCLAVAFPAAGDDVVVRWDEYPVLVEATGPVVVAAAGTGDPSITATVVSEIKLGTPGDANLRLSGPNLSINSYIGGALISSHPDLADRDAADAHPLAAITGLSDALAGKEATIVSEFAGRKIVREPVPIARDEPLKLELQHFVESIQQHRDPLVTGEAAKQALEVAMEITGLIQKSR
jgi:hypothetical protein